jgi:hypothetical protein
LNVAVASHCCNQPESPPQRRTEIVGWILGAHLTRSYTALGFRKETIIEYMTQFNASMFLVIALGSPDEVRDAKSTLVAIKHSGMKEHGHSE